MALRTFVFATTLAVILAGCGTPSTGPADPAPTPAPTPRPEDTGLEAARSWLAGKIGEQKLDIAFDGPSLGLAPPCVLDIEYGSGHGGSLAFVRLEVGATTTKCERVSWQAYLKDPAKIPGGASRAEVPTTTAAPLLDAVRAMSAARVTIPESKQAWSSSGDFFVLVRVIGSGATPDKTWEFAGYSGSRGQSVYAAPQVVVARAREMLDSLVWTPVPTDDLRKTHFPDAFTRDREILGTEFHWWVMERSIEALGWFGDRSAIPTITWIRDHAHKLIQRQEVKIRHILEEPGVFLEGPPREVAE
ncbi:MAG: hypothetical protein K8T20_05115 [Planctomycetes bacterium]|nr:hypothetical protein [Planctomycetota bacterium]